MDYDKERTRLIEQALEGEPNSTVALYQGAVNYLSRTRLRLATNSKLTAAEHAYFEQVSEHCRLYEDDILAAYADECAERDARAAALPDASDATLH